MSANPIDKNSTPNPTGSLENLFRHHLGEEAAVPPRPMLWDQIDNSLLVRQNETYRRRLAATRWVAAASLLLATLAGTGWWAHRATDSAGTEVATHTTDSGSAPLAEQGTRGRIASGQASAPAKATDAFGTGNASAPASAYNNAGSNETAVASNSSTAARSARVAGSVRSQTGFGTNAVRAGREGEAGAIATTNQSGIGNEAATNGALPGSAASLEGAANTQSALATNNVPATGSQAAGLNDAKNADAVAAGTTTAPALPSSFFGRNAAAGSPTVAAFVPGASVALPQQVGLLATAPASLALQAPAALPQGLAALSLPAEADPVVAAASRKWHYGASYTAGTFNPNINFSREGLGAEYAYNPALGADSPALTEAAAAEYRDNLNSGFSQRIALVAKRHLAGNWSLNTGAELSQATAKSASTSAFVGEQLLDLGQFSTGALRTTSFRYRTAGIPVSLSYSNAEKRGWSLYGRLGGVVSALFGVRSEVEGSPEATRTYSLASAGTPYRRVLGSVRGAVGAQYRSASGGWALTLAPVAELGLVPLNAHPAQSYFAQSRPYSFGLEAAVEFGR